MNILLNLRSYDPAQMEKGKRAPEKAEKAVCVTLESPLQQHAYAADRSGQPGRSGGVFLHSRHL